MWYQHHLIIVVQWSLVRCLTPPMAVILCNLPVHFRSQYPDGNRVVFTWTLSHLHSGMTGKMRCQKAPDGCDNDLHLRLPLANPANL